MSNDIGASMKFCTNGKNIPCFRMLSLRVLRKRLKLRKNYEGWNCSPLKVIKSPSYHISIY